MSQSRHNATARKGFSLLEVVVSIGVLSIGLTSMAFLVAQAIRGTDRSKYMSLATTLASEKLEDLNRWPENDPHIVVPAGTTAGSLNSDLVTNVTVGGVTTDVNYFDQLAVSVSGGAYSQIVSGLDASGNTVYTRTSHQPDGTVQTVTSASLGSGTWSQGTVIYKRRWLIEKDVPVVGVRRITILVTLEGPFVRPPVSFQMSTVRP